MPCCPFEHLVKLEKQHAMNIFNENSDEDPLHLPRQLMWVVTEKKTNEKKTHHGAHHAMFLLNQWDPRNGAGYKISNIAQDNCNTLGESLGVCGCPSFQNSPCLFN